MSWFVFLFICCPHYYDLARGFARSRSLVHQRHPSNELLFITDVCALCAVRMYVFQCPFSVSSFLFISFVHIQHFTRHSSHMCKSVYEGAFVSHIRTNIASQFLFLCFVFFFCSRCYRWSMAQRCHVWCSHFGLCLFRSSFSVRRYAREDEIAHTTSRDVYSAWRCHVDGFKRRK